MTRPEGWNGSKAGAENASRVALISTVWLALAAACRNGTES